MRKTKVISRAELPGRLPIYQTILIWLLLDRMQASQWIWGVMGTLFGLLWIGSIVALIKEEQVSVLDPSKAEEPRHP